CCRTWPSGPRWRCCRRTPPRSSSCTRWSSPSDTPGTAGRSDTHTQTHTHTPTHTHTHTHTTTQTTNTHTHPHTPPPHKQKTHTNKSPQTPPISSIKPSHFYFLPKKKKPSQNSL